ncbi:kinase-like domain-containing protein [Phyllosticta citricarpa]
MKWHNAQFFLKFAIGPSLALLNGLLGARTEAVKIPTCAAARQQYSQPSLHNAHKRALTRSIWIMNFGDLQSVHIKLHNKRSVLMNTRPPNSESVSQSGEDTSQNHKRWKTRELLTVGMSAMIYQTSEDRIVKIPKLRTKDQPDFEFYNSVCQEELANEKAVIGRLGAHPHILRCFGFCGTGADDNGIEYAFANQGSLGALILDKQPSPLELRKEWIRSIAEAFDHVHSRRVFHGDIHLFNFLLHNDAISLCDFGQSELLPLDTDMMAWKSKQEETVQVEMLYLGYVFYSIMVWKETKYDWWETKTFPAMADRPSLDGIPFADVILKCWTGGYRSMAELKDEVSEAEEEMLRTRS